MKAAEINQRFLRFFEQRGHARVPSASLVSGDATTLFVIAGMVPFMPYFLGQQPAPYQRATSIQKCVRTVDIERVGTNTRSLTFFQMAGNFSFGDYFKETAIPLAWQLLTTPRDEGGFGLPTERLWATVYHDDDEAADIWTGTVGLPPERLQRRGREDNYWSMGGPGPCGPCSEIYYDRGPEYGAEGGPIADEDRYLEVWNLVFMQYERGPGDGKGDFEILGDLPTKNIDTGLGVERMATVLQGVDNIYETDLLRPILDRAAGITGARYGDNHAADVRLRVVADHMRTVVMLIGDGVTPSNEARGYVVRRMLRRVIHQMRLLGADGSTIRELVAAAIHDAMGPSYPALEEDYGRIEAVAAAEEESFLATLRTGTALFERAAEDARASGSVLSGERAFTLHDTYGFPIDLTLEMAAEAGLTVDQDEFRRLMQEQRSKSQEDYRKGKMRGADVGVYRDLQAEAGGSTFTGYVEVLAEATVTGLLVGGKPAPAAQEGDEIELILDRTPFYAEAGGQLADTGRILLANGGELEVLDAQRPIPDLIVHRARVLSGEVTVGEAAVASVDVDRRRAVSRAHTATHLVHQAFRRALGPQAAQAGSLNDAGRFRFDFTSPVVPSPGLLDDVEGEVNSVLAADLPVRAFVTTQDEARRIGALALFNEKYGDAVRVVEVGDYARELCGGTHAMRSGQLGVVKLLSEGSISAGTRRVEGLVGIDAFNFLAREHALVSQLADTLKARPEELLDRVTATLARLRDVERELERSRASAVLSEVPRLAGEATDEFGVAVVNHRAPDGTGADDLRKLALAVRERITDRPAVVAVGAVTGGRPVVVVAVNDAGRGWGLAAGELVRRAAETLGGGGGGKDDVAQGGGTNAAAIHDALTAVRHRVGEIVTGGS